MAAMPSEESQLVRGDGFKASAGAPPPYRFVFRWRKMAQFMGPGWVMSLAYLDPGNLEADLQQGAYTNMRLLWVLWWATAAGLLLQELSSRLCVVTGQDLAEVSKAHYSRATSLGLYAMMELAIIGSDIQEVVGSAIAFNLLFGWPLWLGCLVTGLDSFTFLAVYQCGVRYFEALIASLIVVIATCFFANFATTHLAAAEVLRGLAVPSLPRSGMVTAVGTLGAVIMPHNLYLHSGLIKTRVQVLDRRDAGAVADANWYSFLESALALLVSFAINLAVVGTFAHFFFSPACGAQGLACVPHTLNRPIARLAHEGGQGGQGGEGEACTNHVIGLADDAACGEIGLDEAGDALAATIGPWGVKVWAVGLLAAGQASTMSTTFAGQVVMDGFLNLRLKPWQRATITRLAALGPSILIAVYTSDDAGTRNTINEWLNILQSIQLPFAVIPALTFTASHAVMGGSRFANRGLNLALSVGLTFLVLASNVFLVVDYFRTADKADNADTAHDGDDNEGGDEGGDKGAAAATGSSWLEPTAAVLGAAYFAFVASLLRSAYRHASAGAHAAAAAAATEAEAEEEEEETSALDVAAPETAWDAGAGGLGLGLGLGGGGGRLGEGYGALPSSSGGVDTRRRGIQVETSARRGVRVEV